MTPATVTNWGRRIEIDAILNGCRPCGRRATRRFSNKQASKLARRLRRHLVHAAGDVYNECAIVLAMSDMLEAALELGVRIPRSVR